MVTCFFLQEMVDILWLFLFQKVSETAADDGMEHFGQNKLGCGCSGRL